MLWVEIDAVPPNDIIKFIVKDRESDSYCNTAFQDMIVLKQMLPPDTCIRARTCFLLCRKNI